MTFCCDNIRKAYELISDVKGVLRLVKVRGGDPLTNLWDNIVDANSLGGLGVGSQSQSRMDRIQTNLNNATMAIDNCNCESEKSRLKSEVSRLLNSYNNLNGNSNDSYNKLVNEYNELLTKHRVLAEKHQNLVDKHNDLVDKYNDINTKYEEYKERYEDARDRRETELVDSAITSTSLRERLGSANEKVADLARRLTDSENRVMRAERSAESILEQRHQQIENLQQLSTDLQIQASINESESSRLRKELNERLDPLELQVILFSQETELSEKSRELAEVRRELERVRTERDERITPLELQELVQNLQVKDKRTENLEKELGQLQEQSLEQKLCDEENKLERMAKKLKIDWEIIQALRDSYEELIRAKNTLTRDDIRDCQGKIEVLRQSLLGRDDDISEVQEIGEQCNEVAKLRFQLEQKLEARIEVPTNLL